jgi:phage replication O-like protein O
VVNVANVQIENGFTRIANELMENIPYFKFNGTQLRLLLVIFRYTYGFSRKSHELSISYLITATGIHREQVKRELSTLIKCNVVTVVREATFTTPRILGLNKDYDTWDIPRNKPKDTLVAKTLPGSEKDCTQVAKKVPPPGSELASQERKNINKTLKKNTAYPSDFEKFYSEYPRPEDKRRTYNNWRTCLKTHTVEQLIAACRNYKSAKAGTEKQFLKTSANFLGREKPFEDYLPENYQEQQGQNENYGINLPPHEKYFD